MRRLILSFLAIVSLTIPAQANDFAAAVGFRTNNANAVAAGSDTENENGLQAGVIGFFDFSDVFGLRSGFLFSQRNYTLKAGTTTSEIDLGYFDIPFTATFKFADYARIFAGPVVALNLWDKCELSGGGTCTVKDPDSISLGLQLGVSFKFAPQFGGEIYYELLPGDFIDDSLKDSKTVGANLLVTFE